MLTQMGKIAICNDIQIRNRKGNSELDSWTYVSDKQLAPNEVKAGAKRCTKAVARITPEPKYFVPSKTISGIRILLTLFDTIGKSVPNREVARITKMAAILRLMLPV